MNIQTAFSSVQKTFLLASVFAGASLSAADTSSAFSDAAMNEGGSYSNWIGTFTPEGALAPVGFIDHAEHGRLYLSSSGQDVFLYDPNVAALGAPFAGWIYTNRSLHPYFYVYGANAWLIYLPGVLAGDRESRVFLNASSLAPVQLSKESRHDVIQTAVANGNFTSLAAALTRAGLIDALKQPGPFTVFAPLDSAFAKLDPATLNALLTDDAQLATLTGILTYHVVVGDYRAADLGVGLALGSATGGLTSFEGSTIQVSTSPEGVLLNGSAKVVIPDIVVGNGVIHVIDTVITPPAK